MGEEAGSHETGIFSRVGEVGEALNQLVATKLELPRQISTCSTVIIIDGGFIDDLDHRSNSFEVLAAPSIRFAAMKWR